MTSKEKAEEFCDDWMHYSGDPQAAHESLAALLDQYAAEQRKRCGYKAAQYLSEDAEGFVSDLNAENAASEILRVCLEAVEADNE